MRDSEKVSADAPGASKATANARNSVSKPIKAESIKKYYQVSIRAKRADSWGNAGVYCTHPFLAVSKDEAIGMAVSYVSDLFPKHMIISDEITCYPLNLKAL